MMTMTSIQDLKTSRKHLPSSITCARGQHKRLYPSTSDILILTQPPAIEAGLILDTRQSLLAAQTETPASEHWQAWSSIRQLSGRSLMANEIDPFLEQHMMLEAMDRQRDHGGAAKSFNAMFCEEHEDSTVSTIMTTTTTSNDENTTETCPLTFPARQEGKIMKAWRKVFKSQRRRRKEKIASNSSIQQ